MGSRLLKALLVVALSGLVTGCFLEVVVPTGGNVSSGSGNYDCAESSNCATEIPATNFVDTFEAIPNEDYEFVRWMGGDDFLCDDSTNPVCNVNNAVLSGSPVLEAFVASSVQTWYIMPVFRPLESTDTDGDGTPDHLDADDDNDGIEDGLDACPLRAPNLNSYGCPYAEITGNDLVISGIAGDAEWAEVDLFVGLSWNKINAVCSPVCAVGGGLNDHDMTGWTWASPDEMNAHFNGALPILAMGPGPESVQTALSTYDDYRDVYPFRPTQDSGFGVLHIYGSTSTLSPPDSFGNIHGSAAAVQKWALLDYTEFSTDALASLSTGHSSTGAWFYRTP